jgi:hypothetical protein
MIAFVPCLALDEEIDLELADAVLRQDAVAEFDELSWAR